NTNGTTGIEFNGTNYTLTGLNITAGVYNFSRTDLAVGVYNYYWWAYGNGNDHLFNRTSIISYIINKSSDLCSIEFNATSPQNYLTIFKVYSNCSSYFYMTRNETMITNNSEQNLSVGYYNFTVYRNDTFNYTNVISSFDFQISRASSLVYAYINDSRSNLTISNDSQIWLNCSRQSGEANVKLYNNGTLINSGLTIANLTNYTTLGSYNITCLYEETQNYSSSYETWWVNVADMIYPIFSNYSDNSGTFITNGTGWFNVTVENTNGTILLQINNLNYTATNLTSNVYNVSVDFTSAGTYSYEWISFGNGSSKNQNISLLRDYVVNSTSGTDSGTGGSGLGGAPSNNCYNWVCSEWEECIDGIKKRECINKGICKGITGKPEESESCDIVFEDEQSNQQRPQLYQINPNISNSKLNFIDYVLILIALLLIVLAIIIFFVRKKKKTLKKEKSFKNNKK
ncbi:MAG: hypothetical protein PHF67_00880, partial [Candidatus Nanoarchaeia archaeon]|nr:hypothetical protein [Candidatus Nanoarchaeia archaeon]